VNWYRHKKQNTNIDSIDTMCMFCQNQNNFLTFSTFADTKMHAHGVYKQNQL